jgi:hypothetical protein
LRLKKRENRDFYSVGGKPLKAASFGILIEGARNGGVQGRVQLFCFDEDL